MSKRHRSHPAGGGTDAADGAGLAALRSQVEGLLARGKTRDAVETARRLHKETRSAETEALLVQAYAARVRALAASRLTREAKELAALVAERHPAARAGIMSLIHESAARAEGDLGSLLRALATADAAGRRELEMVLGRVLADPRALADHPALPEDDPLRLAARAVSEAFIAVTTGPLAEGALAPLATIPRHSPLAPWKLLIRAIDAYYRRSDGAVLANISAIHPDSAPARLVPVLRDLAGAARSAERSSPAERLLLDKVSAGRARFRARLADLLDSLRARDQRSAVNAVRELAEAADSAPRAFRATFRATMLTHWMRLGHDARPFMAALLRGRPDLDSHRQIALAFERAAAWPAALAAWATYLEEAQQAGALPRAGREVSRVLLRMAGLIPTDVEELLDFIGVEDEAELMRSIHDGATPECFDRARLLERALAADPAPDVFRALVAHWEPRDARRAEAEARAWRTRHPQSLEPLLYLARAAEGRGAHQKALDLLRHAEALDRVHPEVRRSRFRVLLSSVERYISEGRVERARAHIDRLAVEPDAAERDRTGYVTALRWAAARRAGEATPAAAIEAELDQRLANPVLVDLLLASIAAPLGLDEPSVRPRLAQTMLTAPKLQAIEALARAADLFLPLGRPLSVPVGLTARIELNPRGAPAAHLHSLCALARGLNRPALAYAAAGAGLELESPLTHRFLLARGHALAQAPLMSENARARRCLRAARALAARLRDQETLREASAALSGLSPFLSLFSEREPEDENDMTAAEVRRVAEDERTTPLMPRFEPVAPGRRRRRQGRRRGSPMPSRGEVLDILEPGS